MSAADPADEARRWLAYARDALHAEKRAAFFDHARRVSERAGLSTDEADELAEEAVAWARRTRVK